MTDRELLELAAKAAGLSFCIAPQYSDYSRLDWGKQVPHADGEPWNPRDDDGDALRLAVRLGMSVDTALGQSLAIACNGKDCLEPHNGDPYAATRRAILRAAAEIGRQMGLKGDSNG